MSTDRETTRIVRSWLEEGATQFPDTVLDRVLDQLPATRQRRATWWPARRFSHMNTIGRYSLVAAITAIAVLGIYMFQRPSIGESPGVEATPSPSPSASTPEPEALLTGSQGPGTFATEFYSEAEIASPVPFTFRMPAGWEGVRPWVISGQGTMVFVQVSGLYGDPCLANAGEPDIGIGSTAAELAAALAAHPAYEATETGTFTIDGYDGVRMAVTTPSDLDYSTCQEESFWLWDGPLFAGAPSQFDIWIFDLGGSTAVVLGEGTSQIEQIVESIDIQP